MTSKLSLYNSSLFVIRQRKLDALTDDELSRYTIDQVYDETLQYMLEEGAWTFAKRSVALEHSVVVEPTFGYEYAFEKPDDWARTISIAPNSLFWPPMAAEEYADESAAWHANCDPLYVTYVSNDTSYGLDLSLWPATFTRAVSYEIASRIAPHLTNMSGDDLAKLEKDAYRRLRDARNKDALNLAGKIPPPGRLTRARAGMLGSNMRRQQP